MAKIDSTKVSYDSMKSDLERDSINLKNAFTLHREEVVSFLMDNIFHVDLSVPDVVRGKFSEKLKN